MWLLMFVLFFKKRSLNIHTFPLLKYEYVLVSSSVTVDWISFGLCIKHLRSSSACSSFSLKLHKVKYLSQVWCFSGGSMYISSKWYVWFLFKLKIFLSFKDL